MCFDNGAGADEKCSAKVQLLTKLVHRATFSVWFTGAEQHGDNASTDLEYEKFEIFILWCHTRGPAI